MLTQHRWIKSCYVQTNWHFCWFAGSVGLGCWDSIEEVRVQILLDFFKLPFHNCINCISTLQLWWSTYFASISSSHSLNIHEIHTFIHFRLSFCNCISCVSLRWSSLHCNWCNVNDVHWHLQSVYLGLS